MSDAKRLCQVDDENAKLKRVRVEVILDNAILKAIATTMVSPAARRVRASQ